MNIKISKADIIWSYIAQFLQMSAGILVLPYTLKMLTAEEVGFNYIMLTVGSLVALLDFGFSPQFGRNISYIFGGADQLIKEGVVQSQSMEINWSLLSNMIHVAKKVYFILSFFAFTLMITFGTWYIYTVTDGFCSISHVLLIWGLYSFSVYFNIYVSYYNALLTGSGKIKESKIAIVISRLSYLFISYVLLYYGIGLIGLSIAYLVQPFVVTVLSKHYFYTKHLKDKLKQYKYSKEDVHKLFMIIWYNAKRLGINNLGAYGITKMGMFLAGLYLSLEEVSSYGLMIQLITAIGTISGIFLVTYMPQLSAFRVSGDKENLISTFSLSMVLNYIIFFSLCTGLILVGPMFINILGSSSKLPSTGIIVLYSIVILLENNHSSFASLITTNNEIPFVKAGLLSGIFISILSLFSLRFTNMGLLGLVLVQGICQLAYNNWKWPMYILEEFEMSYVDLIKNGFNSLKNQIRHE